MRSPYRYSKYSGTFPSIVPAFLTSQMDICQHRYAPNITRRVWLRHSAGQRAAYGVAIAALTQKTNPIFATNCNVFISLQGIVGSLKEDAGLCTFPS